MHQRVQKEDTMFGTHKMTTQDVLSAFTAEELTKAGESIAHQIDAEQTSDIRTDLYLKVKRQGQEVVVTSVCILRNIDKTYMVVPDYGNHQPVGKIHTAGKSSLIAQDYLLAMLLFASRYIGTETT